MLRVAIWCAGVALLAVAANVLILMNRDDLANALAWVVTLLSILTLAVPLLLLRYDRLALAWFRVRNQIWHSPSLPWRLTVGMSGDFAQPGYFDRVETGLHRALPGRVRSLRPAPVNGRQIAVDGLGFVELALDDLASDKPMTVSFTGLRVAPHEAERILDRELLPVVRIVESEAEHPGREQSWALRVAIDANSNPYIPILMRNAGPDNIALFQAVYRVPRSSDRVNLGKESMYLEASTAESFQALVRDFVTFSGRGLRPPGAHA